MTESLKLPLCLLPMDLPNQVCLPENPMAFLVNDRPCLALPPSHADSTTTRAAGDIST